MCHLKARNGKESEGRTLAHSIRNLTLRLAQLDHLSESKQIIEPAVAFDIYSHSNAELGCCLNPCNRDPSVLAVLALREPDVKQVLGAL